MINFYENKIEQDHFMVFLKGHLDNSSNTQLKRGEEIGVKGLFHVNGIWHICGNDKEGIALFGDEKSLFWIDIASNYIFGGNIEQLKEVYERKKQDFIGDYLNLGFDSLKSDCNKKAPEPKILKPLSEITPAQALVACQILNPIVFENNPPSSWIIATYEQVRLDGRGWRVFRKNVAIGFDIDFENGEIFVVLETEDDLVIQHVYTENVYLLTRYLISQGIGFGFLQGTDGNFERRSAIIKIGQTLRGIEFENKETCS